MITYVGKCLLIEEGKSRKKERVLVIGDIHLGYEREDIHAAGALNAQHFEKQVFEDLMEAFERIGNVDVIVLLGDIKHRFVQIDMYGRHALVNLFDCLMKWTKKIVIIKGNHDTYLENVTRSRKIEVVDFHTWKEYCFMHGDRAFEEIKDKNIMFWIMGHLHPMVTIRDGVKAERYKCFLQGRYKGKEIIILPSFSEASKGSDILTYKSNLAWNFNLKRFNVFVVGENLDVLSFGKLRKIK